MRVLYTAPIKPANFVRRTESKLDRLWASGRDRLQHSSADQVSLDLVVVTNQVTQSRQGTGAEDHAAQLILIPESTHDSCRSDSRKHCIAVSHSYYCDHRAPDMLLGL